jgi:hypothetical protein
MREMKSEVKIRKIYFPAIRHKKVRAICGETLTEN